MLAGCFDLENCGLTRNPAEGLGIPTAAASGCDETIRRPRLVMMASQGSTASAPSGDAVAWDGRLDNRDDFRRGHDATDAGIALAAYGSAGESALRELVGDWSAVFWDAGRAAVLLGSDYAGVRPLYYSLTARQLHWSSSLAQLAASLPDDGGLDPEFAAGFLSRGGSWDRTPYRAIRVVPPGHVLRVSRDGAQITGFWHPRTERLQFRDERDYAAHFRSLFEEAVAVRLRTGQTVCAELSGGLDSSAVVCMAHRLIGEGRVAARRLSTLHYCHEGSRDMSFHQILRKSLDLDAAFLDTNDYPYVSAESVGRPAPMWWESRTTHIAQHLDRCGAGVLLTGRLGDLVTGNYLPGAEQVGDSLWDLSVGKAFSQAMAWSRVLHTPVYSLLRQAVGSVLSGIGGPRPSEPENSFSRDLLDRARTETSGPAAAADWKHASPSFRKRASLLTDALRSRTLQTPAPLQSVAYTHPYAHRPLVEYMLAIPSAAICGAGQPRRLMREALRDLLPPAILARRSKASFRPVFRAALQPLAVRLLREQPELRVVSRGWIDERSFASRLQRFQDGLECNESQLGQIILLEFWLRNFEARGSRTAVDLGSGVR